MDDWQIIKQKIDAIDARLASGIESVSTDGTSTKVNLEKLHEERRRLMQTLNRLQPWGTRRPVASRIELGGF